MNLKATIDKFRQKVVIPLKEGGKNIYFEQSNKNGYTALSLDWYFDKSIESQFAYFKNRFYRICDNKLAHVKIFYFIYDIVINSWKIVVNNL